MELRDYIRILHKYWVLILVTTLLGIATGAAASLMTTPKYDAKTQLYVSVRGEGTATGDLVQGSNFARQSVQSYVRIATTDKVLDPVIDELGLTETSDQLATKIKASAPLNTSIIEIVATSSDPIEAADLANAVGQSFAHIVQNELEILETKEGPDGETETASPVKLTTVQQASPPTSPVSPRLSLNLALGALVGLALGIGIAVLRTVLDTRIHSLHDIEQVTDAPLIGGIAFDPDAPKRPLIVHADPRSPRAESFRTVRTNLQFLAVSEEGENRGKSFVISSAGPGEGKSTTTANLAIALAETGAKVVLIDGDLRLRKIAEYMGIEGGAGLTDVLIGKAEIAEVLQRWGRGQLYVLPAGRVPPNPSELLGSNTMGELMHTLQEHFDYILVDSPPLLMVTDAAVLNKHTHGTLLVAASGSTRKPALEMGIRTLVAAGGKLRGVIVTMLPTKGADSYGYGVYGYGNQAYGSQNYGADGQGAKNGTNSAGEIGEDTGRIAVFGKPKRQRNK